MSIWVVILSLFAACNAMDDNNQITIHGHRGCRGLLPENTIPAFHKALDLGVNAIEIDLVCTADGRLLVSHDPYMLHDICTKPDGSLISDKEEKSLNIYKMTLQEAQSYICGTLPHPRFTEQRQVKTYKPSFIEFVTDLREYCHLKNKPFPLLNIEIKSEPEWDSLFHPVPDEYTNIFLDEFNLLKIEEKSLIQSFDPRILESLHSKQPKLKLMLLVGGEKKDVASNLSVLSFKPYAYCPHFGLVDEGVVKYCDDNNTKLIVWTVNELEDIQRVLDVGVRNVITDYPNRANEVVERWKKN